jgi:hypothetical protein
MMEAKEGEREGSRAVILIVFTRKCRVGFRHFRPNTGYFWHFRPNTGYFRPTI